MGNGDSLKVANLEGDRVKTEIKYDELIWGDGSCVELVRLWGRAFKVSFSGIQWIKRGPRQLIH